MTRDLFKVSPAINQGPLPGQSLSVKCNLGFLKEGTVCVKPRSVKPEAPL